MNATIHLPGDYEVVRRQSMFGTVKEEVVYTGAKSSCESEAEFLANDEVVHGVTYWVRKTKKESK